MQRSFFAAILVTVIGFVPALVFAQGGDTGMVIGSVYDQGGNPLKGVKVTARSDTQIGGTKTAYTNDEGNFRFPGLLPGTFEVSASAPKLKSVVQRGLKVGINSPAQVDLVMEVATVEAEEVKVIEKAPVVNTTSASVKEVYDDEFVDNLPVDVRTAVENFVGNNTPGTYGAGTRSARVRGGSTEQNAFMVEGFYMNGQKVLMNSLAALEVQTAGYGAEYANVPGGVVNMVSKSGSNRYEFEISAYGEDSKMKFFKDAIDTENRNWVYMVNPTFSGPIVKDRLWFYLNAEARSEVTFPGQDPSGLNLLGDPATRSYISLRPSLKLTWQVSPRNKLSSYSTINEVLVKNSADPLVHERDAQNSREDQFYFTGLVWESLLSDKLFFKSQIGLQSFWVESKPGRCSSEPETCDYIPQVRQNLPRAIRLGNFNQHFQDINQSLEIINSLEWYASHKVLGEHAVKAKSRVFSRRFERADSVPGDGYVTYNGTVPDRFTEFWGNDPRQEQGRRGYRITGSTGTVLSHSLVDSFRPTRYLTLTPGIAMTNSHAEAVGTQASLSFMSVTPSIAAAWDPTHDGRTALRGSFSQYVDTDVVRLARHALGTQVSRDCRWNETDQAFNTNCTYSGGTLGRTIGLPCGAGGIDQQGAPCRENLKIPRTWEYTAGVEREITQGISLAGDVVYRRYDTPYESIETNRVWNNAGTNLSPDGGYKNGRAETIDDLATPSAAKRRYLGITAEIRKREGALKTSAAYTWSELQGNVNNNESNEYGENPGREPYLYGYLPDDARHQLRIQATYQVTKWLSTGILWRYYSGRPYQRRYYDDVLGTFSDYRARVGINPSTNINDPGDDRPLRLPDQMSANLQARVNFKQLTGVNAEAFLDVLNFLALRTTTSVDQQDGVAWGTSTGRMPPLTLRIGGRYRY